MKTIKKFNSHSEYLNFIENNVFLRPNVAFCKEENEVHMEKDIQTPVLTCTYNVKSTASQTKIASSITSITDTMYVDGVQLENVVQFYGFSTTGEHVVQFVLQHDAFKIPNDAFRSCSDMLTISMSNHGNIVEMGDRAFHTCRGMTSAHIPEGIKIIDNRSFIECESLVDVNIPEEVETILEYAFHKCYLLKEIILPHTLKRIDTSAFIRCSSMTSITCLAATPPTGGQNMFGNQASGRKIYVPLGSLELYKTAPYWSVYAADIEPIGE